MVKQTLEQIAQISNEIATILRHAARFVIIPAVMGVREKCSRGYRLEFAGLRIAHESALGKVYGSRG